MGPEEHDSDPSTADEHAAGRAVDAIPVVLDPFVMTLVPTSRAVRTVRQQGRTPADRGTTRPSDATSDATEGGTPSPEQVRDHLRRRAIFLRELAEARELRERVTPHRARRARIHAALRRRTFRVT
ncbi:hypothetical protein SMC26_32020 [Actinomadura fulvescens]|uniref:Uncharacterized protein n=1 Tax=Actinomadura fulvescens TaxID=46160 RepID=A0ABN3Q787_9ACTN